MKTAISVPDDIYAEAEALARREGRTRSDVHSTALREYVARHSIDEVTQAIDSAMARLGDQTEGDAFTRAATSAVLEASEW